MHDAITLEDRGIPAIAIHTHTFMNSAAAHARAYGRPDFRSLAVPGPIANVSEQRVHEKAQEVLDSLVRLLTGAGI